MTKSFKIITLGCKVNQYESAYLSETLAHAGWVRAKKDDKADVAIINTCIVTQRAAHQSRQAIRKALRENPDGTVAATGCYAQVFPQELEQINGIGLIAGNTTKAKLPELLLENADPGGESLVLKDFEPGMPFEPLPIKRFPGRTRAYLKIQDGCQSFCTYCIVPFARGPCRSLSQQRVLSMLDALSSEGYKEVVLTGIHLGKYGIDLKEEADLNRLLHAIGRQGLPLRIRLSSIEPNEINDELIDMVGNEKWLCRHFHIPLQSGDDRILKRMNRNYKAQEFARVIEAIHARTPQAGIGVDVMSGFPGEGPIEHQNTLSLITDLPVSYLHVFPFSNRTGTAASSFDGQVDPGIIKKRASELRDIGQQKRSVFYQACLKKEFLVLAETWHSKENKIMKGMSDNNLPVLFSSSQESKGRFVPVRTEKVENNMVIGSAS